MQLQTQDAVDLDAYFHRIGYRGECTPTLNTLQALHLCHATSIPFENLSSLIKQPVLLDLKSLQQKLIDQKRGGYCFEQNLLFRSVLLALGFQVTNLAARVLWNLPDGTITPRSHMLLQVEIEGQAYIVDVGFGGLTLTAPLVLLSDLEQDTPHEPFRLVATDPTDHTYTMQVKLGEAWKSLYRFDLQAQQFPDYEVSNWYVSTHPNSLFVTSLIAAKPTSEHRYALRNNQLTVHSLNGETEQRVLNTVPDLRATLEHEFQIRLPEVAGLDDALQQMIQG